MGHRYGIKTTENQAKAVALSIPVSTKHAVEVCRSVRGLPIEKAKSVLSDAIALKKPIPFKRYKRNIGHRRGIASGRYPVKTCKAVLELIESASKNAQFKGLGANLFVKHIRAIKGPSARRYGRRNRSAKRTHVEVVLEEK